MAHMPHDLFCQELDERGWACHIGRSHLGTQERKETQERENSLGDGDVRGGPLASSMHEL